jgi:uncharacterized membrane protein
MPELVSGEVSVRVARPPAEVYPLLADLGEHAAWANNLSRVDKVSAGPIAVGTRFRANEGAPPVSLQRRLASMLFFIVGLLRGANTYSEAEITALEPNRRIAWVAWVAGRNGEFNRAEWEFVLTPRDGGTQITQHFRYLPRTAEGAAMLQVLGGSRGIEAASASNLARLKVWLEAPNRQL